MPELWTPEVEKKYQLPNELKSTEISGRAIEAGLNLTGWILQKDWVPDLSGYKMRDQNILLRIRNNTYLEGEGPRWVVTLKRKSVIDGVHQNTELEADSDNAVRLREVASFVESIFGV